MLMVGFVVVVYVWFVVLLYFLFGVYVVSVCVVCNVIYVYFDIVVEDLDFMLYVLIV